MVGGDLVWIGGLVVGGLVLWLMVDLWWIGVWLMVDW